jgi:hypothetical protein
MDYTDTLEISRTPYVCKICKRRITKGSRVAFVAYTDYVYVHGGFEDVDKPGEPKYRHGVHVDYNDSEVFHEECLKRVTNSK